MKIAVIGTGYVGLVSGSCLAEAGNEVTCVDIDKVKVQQMRTGKVPIYEPGLDKMFQRNIKEGRIHFTTSLKAGVSKAEIIFLCLPTPEGADGSADLSSVLKVADSLGPLLSGYTVIINKSTVPVGTARKVKKQIANKTKVAFDVVSNPEFLREGFAIEDFMKPDRIVVGTSSKAAKDLMVRLYRPFVRQGNPIIFMDEHSAEMTKYAANAFLATKISFMNEIANLCEKLDADVDMVRLGIGSDERIGKRFLFAGIGYGGSCFPKDVAALDKMAQDNSYEFKIVKAVNEVNNLQKNRLVEKIMSYYKHDLSNKKFALWGLAFKPDTDDVREAPSLTIINNLTGSGAKIVAYDPEAANNVRKQYSKNKLLKFADEPYEALNGVDALLIATDWSEFKTPDFKNMKNRMKKPVIFDGRNLFYLDEVSRKGFYYESIGRKIIKGEISG